ncbi:sulfite reductase flavo domain protein [Mycobacterium kansasii 824]|nr:sulfite reductase flavo domain protein [Mycobacterium kansasii 824]
MAFPKNNQFGPVWPSARRSCRNARKGAIPVPGPIMIIGVCGSLGDRKLLAFFT